VRVRARRLVWPWVPIVMSLSLEPDSTAGGGTTRRDPYPPPAPRWGRRAWGGCCEVRDVNTQTLAERLRHGDARGRLGDVIHGSHGSLPGRLFGVTVRAGPVSPGCGVPTGLPCPGTLSKLTVRFLGRCIPIPSRLFL